MEAVAQLRARRIYYFSYLDHEILDERTLVLPCDEDTWLYKVQVEAPSLNGQQMRYHLGSALQDQPSQSYSGSVDSRTFTRRKHCALRPSLESVVESPLSNRSSLGLLSDSKLLNKTFHLTPPQSSASPERISSSSTDSEMKLFPRKFKLDSPFLNNSSLRLNRTTSSNCTFERTRLNSESSDAGLSLPQSLETLGSFEQGEQMTDSLVNFLAKGNASVCPPTELRSESPNSLISLPDNLKVNDAVTDGKPELMTGSMVSFLESVNCTPPSSFQDNEMSSSVVDINEADVLPASDLTKSVISYLENGRNNSTKSIVTTCTTPQSENIPPLSHINGCNDTVKATERDRKEEVSKLNSTYELEKNCDAAQVNETIITFTNSLNLSRKRKDSGDIEGDINISKPFTNSVEPEFGLTKEISEKCLKSKALNNRDLNVTQNLDFEDDLNSIMTLHDSRRNGTFTKDDVNSTVTLHSSRRNGTFTKDELEETLRSYKQIPKNSTFNTTFTKLEKETKMLQSPVTQSVERLNGGLEDDQTSSASDSSFSSGSTKPRSVDELRTIAHQQETRLQQQTSTPEATNLAKLDFKLSPIHRQEMESNRKNETRSANCSPVRSPIPRSPYPHPISRLQQSPEDSKLRRQTLQASSMSNLARPRISMLRMPQPVGRFTVPPKAEPRPATAPTPAPAPATGIPRPQASRLPMPRSRGTSNIGRPNTTLRGAKRGGYGYGRQ